MVGSCVCLGLILQELPKATKGGVSEIPISQFPAALTEVMERDFSA
jgi:hypothetical protein